jgi:hypothetical protein
MTNRTRTEEEEILNHLLVSIVEAKGGTIISNDKISLLESWLASIPLTFSMLRFSEGSTIKFSDGSTISYTE